MLPVSDHAREALRLAHEEARALRHSYVGTEHMLLGLLGEHDAVAATMLASLDITHERVRMAVVRMMGEGVEDASGELPFTGAANDAIERAGREASMLGAGRVGTEHILLALTRDAGGAAARILVQLDVDLAEIRAAVGS
ncbi:MAG TPA: Clp protease N-terminal domain-containing protein [Solirubrobacteraceae bacterium]|nr:Clp protease N-terminal domain-containing protein [Solirubrobacteraceae bacterium]